MAAADKAKRLRLYLGVDIGGTKIQAALADESGALLARERCPTPREVGPEEVLAAIERLIEGILRQENLEASALTALGVAVPGVVDPGIGRIIVTPNMTLSGMASSAPFGDSLPRSVVLGNDCNLGILGESWLGWCVGPAVPWGSSLARGLAAGSSGGELWRGAREAAGEIGHIVMQIGGPRCGCGNHGCLEALASRTAIENQLRAAVDAGRKTALTELLEGNLKVIRSSALCRY